MGFFSWNCKGCGKSVRSGYSNSGHAGWMAKAVAVTKNGSIVKGDYDGYGRIGDGDFELGDAGDFSLWHAACWKHAGSPTEFDGQSTHANDQGHFCGEVLTLFPPDYDAELAKVAHAEEISAVLKEIHPRLAAFGVDEEWLFKRVVQQMGLISETNLAHMRREFEDKNNKR